MGNTVGSEASFSPLQWLESQLNSLDNLLTYNNNDTQLNATINSLQGLKTTQHKHVKGMSLKQTVKPAEYSNKELSTAYSVTNNEIRTRTKQTKSPSSKKSTFNWLSLNTSKPPDTTTNTRRHSMIPPTTQQRTVYKQQLSAQQSNVIAKQIIYSTGSTPTNKRMTTKQLLRTSVTTPHKLSVTALNDVTPIKQADVSDAIQTALQQSETVQSQTVQQHKSPVTRSHVRSVSGLIEHAVIQQHKKLQQQLQPVPMQLDEVVINYAAPLAPPINSQPTTIHTTNQPIDTTTTSTINTSIPTAPPFDIPTAPQLTVPHAPPVAPPLAPPMAPPIAPPMISTIPAPPPLAPSLTAPPPAPMLPNISAIPAPQAVAPKQNGKKLHWSSMQTVENTVFNELNTSDNNLSIELDFTELQSKFIDAPVKQVKAVKPIVAAKPQKVSLIDSKRAYNVDISLSRFKQSHTDMINKIKSLDLTDEYLESLLLCIPTLDECKSVQKYKGDLNELDNVSQWFVHCTQLNIHLHTQLQNIYFLSTLSTVLSEIDTELSTVEQACKDLHCNKSLKYIYVIVLKFGNYLNNKQSTSFCLKDLFQLKTLKSFDQSCTLLQYLISIIHKNKNSNNAIADVLLLKQQLKVVYTARKIEQTHCKTKLTALNFKLSQLHKVIQTHTDNNWTQYSEYVQNSVNESIQPAKDLLDRYTHLTTITTHLCHFFGHDTTDQWETLFSTWCEFIDVFTTCNEEYVQQQAVLARQQSTNKHTMQTRRKSKQSIDTVMNNENTVNTLVSPNKRRASRELSSDTIRSPLSPLNPNKRVTHTRKPVDKLQHAIDTFNPIG